MVAANPNYSKACKNVATDGTFQEQDAQINGVLQSNPHLKPEQGEVTTYGFVYDPSWAQGFSASVDFWHYTINDVLVQIDPLFATKQCIATGQMRSAISRSVMAPVPMRVRSRPSCNPPKTSEL